MFHLKRARTICTHPNRPAREGSADPILFDHPLSTYPWLGFDRKQSFKKYEICRLAQSIRVKVGNLPRSIRRDDNNWPHVITFMCLLIAFLKQRKGTDWISHHTHHKRVIFGQVVAISKSVFLKCDCRKHELSPNIVNFDESLTCQTNMINHSFDQSFTF